MPATSDACWCVVPAAGRGTRFGAVRPKQYALLRGQPMLVRTLERLAACVEVRGLVVVLASDVFTTPPSRPADVVVQTTIFDGRVVYQREPGR